MWEKGHAQNHWDFHLVDWQLSVSTTWQTGLDICNLTNYSFVVSKIIEHKKPCFIYIYKKPLTEKKKIFHWCKIDHIAYLISYWNLHSMRPRLFYASPDSFNILYVLWLINVLFCFYTVFNTGNKFSIFLFMWFILSLYFIFNISSCELKIDQLSLLQL